MIAQVIQLEERRRAAPPIPSVRPVLTRLQASALLTLLDDLEQIVLGVEVMPVEFWDHLNAAAHVLKAEIGGAG